MTNDHDAMLLIFQKCRRPRRGRPKNSEKCGQGGWPLCYLYLYVNFYGSGDRGHSSFKG